MSKSNAFRKLLQDPGPVLLGGVYDGLSARLAERGGFDALWASGLCISSSQGIADVGLLSMKELLDTARIINRSSTLPVIADVDDGFGDIITVDRMIREYEAAGIAGICIEDNKHPKRNSLTSDMRCPLVSAEEFSAKIRVAKAASSDPNFVVIARVEALIAGLGMDEAMRRATIYAKAGADLIVMHSKDTTVDPVREFGRLWTPDVPLVAIPTTYADVTLPELYSYGYKVCIFANQGMRAAMAAMEKTFTAMVKHQSIIASDEMTCPLTDLFAISGFDEVRRLEREYAVTEFKRTSSTDAPIAGAAE